MDLPSERNRAANQDGPLLIKIIITHLFKKSQIIYGYFSIKIPGKGIIHTFGSQTGKNQSPIII